MEILRNVVVLGHLIGFAVMFGAWASEAAGRRFEFTRLMNVGLLLSFLTGVVLVAPWPAGIEIDYLKAGVKLVILLIVGALLGIGVARQRRTGSAPPRPVFGAVGVLLLAAAAIGVLWPPA